MEDPYGVGGNCFEVREGETEVFVVVSDQILAGRSVGGETFFLDYAGTVMSETLQLFCATAKRSIPQIAGTLVVAIDAGTGPATCGGGAGVGASGTITATFVGPDEPPA